MDRCYNVYFDVFTSDIDKTLLKFSEIGDVIVRTDHLSVWLKDEFSNKDIDKIMRSIRVRQYYYRVVEYEEVANSQQIDFFYAWFHERYSNYLIRQEEIRRQDELIQMNKNIDDIMRIVNDRIINGGRDQAVGNN